MATQIENRDLYHRAQWVVLRDFDNGFFAAIRECTPEQWPDCSARIVAEHVQSFAGTEQIYEVWQKFPGGFPRFLDMRDKAHEEAKKEQGQSTIDWFSCAMANEVLTAEGIGGK